jgi:hypothetical protein
LTCLVLLLDDFAVEDAELLDVLGVAVKFDADLPVAVIVVDMLALVAMDWQMLVIDTI